MNIDRVARGMTAGHPKQGFTERVMAPIYGRPRPDFTARVMNRIDDESVAQGFIPAWVAQMSRPAFAAAALLLLAAGLMILRANSPLVPPTPHAPRIAALPYSRGPLGAPALPLDRWAIPAAPAVRTPQAPRLAAVRTEPVPEVLTIYTIAPLEAPAEIGLKAIGPQAPVIAPLEGPAPLKINEIKEKS